MKIGEITRPSFFKQTYLMDFNLGKILELNIKSLFKNTFVFQSPKGKFELTRVSLWKPIFELKDINGLILGHLLRHWNGKVEYIDAKGHIFYLKKSNFFGKERFWVNENYGEVARLIQKWTWFKSTIYVEYKENEKNELSIILLWLAFIVLLNEKKGAVAAVA